jgi:RNA polymerase sigma factor (sigma-70 family)
VRSHLPLIRAVAARYSGQGLPLDDLVQEGALGLLDAIGRYDPDRGPDFSSFARFRVRCAMRRALDEQARVVRLPRQILDHRRMVERAEQRLLAASGGRPTPAELAALTGLSVQAVVEARAASPALSLDDGPRGGETLAGRLVDRAADPEAEVIAHEQRRILHLALERLAARQRGVVAARWGVPAGEPRPLRQLAAEIGLSARRTQTIGATALEALRRDLEEADAAPR